MIRAIAVGLAVSPEVVRRALEQLEKAGFLSTGDGSGLFVASPARLAAAGRRPELDILCREFLAHVAQRGFMPAVALAALANTISGV